MSAVEERRSHGVRMLASDDPSAATSDLYRAYGNSVYRFAYHMLGNREDAEDAAQATFLSVHSALGAGTDVREPQAWVLKIARNECLGRITGRMRRPLAGSLDEDGSAEVPARGPSVPHAVELRDDVQVASAALEGLPTTQREAFVLREWLGLSTGEIADSLGTSVSAVDALLNRARRELIRAVAAGDGSAGCGQTRQALQRGLLDRRTRAHLVRCKSCRTARRAVQPGIAGVRALVPPAAIAERLADSLPGFSLAGSAAVATGAAGSGGIAALVAKSALTPIAMKTAAAAALAALAVGGATELHGLSRPHPTRRAVVPPSQPPTPTVETGRAGARARTVLVADTAGTSGGVASSSRGSGAPGGGGVRSGGASGTARRAGEGEGRSGGQTGTRTGGGSGRAGGEDGTRSGGATGSGTGDRTHRFSGTGTGTDGTDGSGARRSGGGETAPSGGTHHHGTWGGSGGTSSGSGTSGGGSGTTAGSGSGGTSGGGANGGGANDASGGSATGGTTGGSTGGTTGGTGGGTGGGDE